MFRPTILDEASLASPRIPLKIPAHMRPVSGHPRSADFLADFFRENC